jgi:hypothetical protein
VRINATTRHYTGPYGQERTISGIQRPTKIRSLRPSRNAADNALVGLLTPEQSEKLAFSSRLQSNLSEDRPADNGLNQLPLTLGYSGGAVPELHRSSLFCRPFQQK